MGETRKARVMFTCEHEIKDYLTEWAESENRTVSNLVETLITEAIATREGQKEPPTSPPSKSKRRGKAGGES
jgi:hypothetical protein